MKIVFIGPFGLRPKMTMQSRALPLAKALVRRGHQVSLLIPPWDDPKRAGQSWVEAGVQVVNLPLPAPIPGLFQLRLAWNLVAGALALRPEVIHFFKPKAYAGLAHLILWWLRRVKGWPVRLVLDTDDWEQAWNERLAYPAWQKKLFAWQEVWGLRHADAVTVASRALEALAAAYRPAGLFYVPNGYLTDPANGANKKEEAASQRVRQQWDLGEAPVVLLYTRFVEYRLERLVTLVRQVAERAPDARWLIVGQGLHGEEEKLAAQLAGAGLASRVRLTGWAAPEQLPAMFQTANVAIFPADDTLINRTKCSVKLIDLLLAGLPVVADAVGQTCEYIQSGVSGLLVPAGDDLAFSQAVAELLQAPNQQQKVGAAARQHLLATFNWDRLAQIVERAYR